MIQKLKITPASRLTARKRPKNFPINDCGTTSLIRLSKIALTKTVKISNTTQHTPKAISWHATGPGEALASAPCRRPPSSTVNPMPRSASDAIGAGASRKGIRRPQRPRCRSDFTAITGVMIIPSACGTDATRMPTRKSLASSLRRTSGVAAAMIRSLIWKAKSPQSSQLNSAARLPGV